MAPTTVVTIPAFDNADIQISCWLPPPNNNNNPPKATVQILHGMVEHCARYDDFATFLSQSHNIAVYAHDHRGHGNGMNRGEGVEPRHPGNFDHLLQDIEWVYQYVIHEHPNVPHFVMGHSMGSALARGWMCQYKPVTTLKGLILTGGIYAPTAICQVYSSLCWMETKRCGARNGSNLIDFLSFSSFNKAFEPVRTKSDWLSRDPAQVDKYEKDELCGGQMSTESWQSFMNLMGRINTDAPYKELKNKKALRIFIASGDKDPAGENGNAPKALVKIFTKAGYQHVEMKLYEDARHEILNETNKEEVKKDLLDWIEAQL